MVSSPLDNCPDASQDDLKGDSEMNHHDLITAPLAKFSSQVPPRGRRIKFTPERIQQIRNLVERGKSREEIAELIKVTVGSLQVTCSRHGISLRRPRLDNGIRLLPRGRPQPPWPRRTNVWHEVTSPRTGVPATNKRPAVRRNSSGRRQIGETRCGVSCPNQTYRRNDVSEIHHRFHCHGCNRLCCVRAPALIDFRRGLRVRLLQLAADILGGFLSAYDHRHLDRNARMAARTWQANRGVMARGSGSGAV